SELARTDVGGRVGTRAALDQPLQHLGAGGLGQPGELRQGSLSLFDFPFGPHPDQDDALQAEPPVFDLGDVREFGGKPCYAAERSPGSSFQLAGGRLVTENEFVLVGRGLSELDGDRPGRFLHIDAIVPCSASEFRTFRSQITPRGQAVLDNGAPRREGLLQTAVTGNGCNETPAPGIPGFCGAEIDDVTCSGKGDRKSTRLNSSHVKISYAV